MSTLSIRRLDPADPSDMQAYADLRATADRALFGATDLMSADQMVVNCTSTPYWDLVDLGAFELGADGRERLVGVGWLQVPLSENPDMVHVGLLVDPDHRGRGIGTALADAVEAAAAATGRPRRTAYGDMSLEGDPDDPGLPITRIAQRWGMTRRTMAVGRALDLPVPGEVLTSMEQAAASHLGDYRIEVFHGEIPRDRWVRLGELFTQLDLDDPDEDIELDVATYDESRLAVHFERLAARGIDFVVAVAVAPDGQWVGNSEIQWRTTPGTDLGWQENTLVMPEHRGHRLGLAMKAATHRRLAEVAPQLTRVVTFNSHINDHMIAINEQLGYRPVVRNVGYQR